MKRLIAIVFLATALCVPVSALARQQSFVGQAVTVTLSNGTKVSGTVTKHEGGKVSLKADLIGEIVIEEKDIAAVGPAPAAAPTATAPSGTPTPTVTWTTTGTAGYSFISGAAPILGVGDTHGVNLSLFTERASEKDAVSLTGTFTFQRTRPAPAAAKNGGVTFAWNHTFNKRFTFITRTTYNEDSVKSIDRRITNLNGLGVVLVQTPKVTFSVVPGIGFTTTNYTITPALARFFANVKNDALGYGVFDYFGFKIMPTLQFSQTFLHVRSFSNSSQHVSQTNLSLVGMISPKVGISINFSNNYDSQMPEPLIKKSTSTLTSGLQFKF